MPEAVLGGGGWGKGSRDLRLLEGGAGGRQQAALDLSLPAPYHPPPQLLALHCLLPTTVSPAAVVVGTNLKQSSNLKILCVENYNNVMYFLCIESKYWGIVLNSGSPWLLINELHWD